MQYPENTLRKLGKMVMSMDFMGPKFLSGEKEGINFLSWKYIRPKKYGIVQRVSGQTTRKYEVIKIITKRSDVKSNKTKEIKKDSKNETDKPPKKDL